jgi:hypothetical protein
MLYLTSMVKTKGEKGILNAATIYMENSELQS